MKRAVKLASKIEALKSELVQVKAAEKQHAERVAKRAIIRAIRSSGLLALVTNGSFAPEALAREFSIMAARAPKTSDLAIPDPEAVKSDTRIGTAAQSETAKMGPFGS